MNMRSDGDSGTAWYGWRRFASNGATLALASVLLGGAGTWATEQRMVIGCDVCPEAVVVPGGTFVMGSEDGEADERPLRDVEVGAFAIGVWEVTGEEFSAYVESTGRGQEVMECVAQGARGRAAGCVTWNEAQEYAEWLSRRTGSRYRLPSEAEWEYVARRSAELGVFDMEGSVSEWVADCWHDDYATAPVDGSAWLGDGRCEVRVVRGVSWLDRDVVRNEARMRERCGPSDLYDGRGGSELGGARWLSNRACIATAADLPDVGFRVARTVP